MLEAHRSESVVISPGFKLPGLRWWIVGLVFLATLINYIDRLTISVLAPVITKDLGLTNTEFGGIVTWFLLAYTISQGLSGKLYDRIGTRLGFVFSISLWSVAAIAHAFARGLGTLSLFRFVLGFGEAGNWPGAAKTVAEWFPIRQRAFGMAIFNSGAAIGSILAPPLIVWLQLRYGWQTTFIVTGVLGFFWLALWLFFYQSPERHRWITDEELRVIKEGQGEWETGRVGEWESGSRGEWGTGRRGGGKNRRTEQIHPVSPSPRHPVFSSPRHPVFSSPRHPVTHSPRLGFAALARPPSLSSGMGDCSFQISDRPGVVALHHLAATVSQSSSWL